MSAYDPDLIKRWFETQQHMMNSWGGLMQHLWQPANDQPFGATTAAWQEMVLQSIRSLTHHTDPTARQVAEKLFTSQIGLIRLIEISLRMWEKILPKIAAGEDWETALQGQLHWLRAELLKAAGDGLNLSGSLSQLWQVFLKDGQPWGKLFPSNGTERDTLMDMTNLYWDAYQNIFGGMLHVSGYNRQMDEALRQSFTAWLDMQHAIFDYNLLLTEAWINAFEKVLRSLAQLVEQGEAIESVRDFLNRWSATADEVFKTTFQSPAYVQAQTKLVNTVMSYRNQQRHVNEAFFQIYDLPTRSEIDESHRRIHELRKEVKALRRELNTLKLELQAERQKTNPGDSTRDQQFTS